MAKALKDYWIAAVLICLGLDAQADSRPPERYTLLSRSNPSHMDVTLDRSQWQWVRNKRELILGTSAPDYPPFDLTLTGRDYEGFTADYVGILGRVLDLPVKVLRFASRDEAILALNQGEIDLLGSANGYEAASSGIALSTPYAVDQPVLVTRTGETRPLNGDLNGLRLSMAYHYLPPDVIAALYPKARLQTFSSFQSAINAVAFNQADVFLGDTISTHYVINKGYLNNVQMANFGKHEANGFSFAVHASNTVLLDIVNGVLKGIPVEERIAISKRWGAGSDLMLTDQKLQLNQREERWIAQHPVVRVVFNEAYAPLTFYDAAGHFSGVTADLLELIRLRTGLTFEVSHAASMNDMASQLSQGQADLIAAMIPSDERENRFNFSRPYLDNVFVLVTRKETSAPSNLDQLDGKRVALTLGSPILPFLREHHPGIYPVEVDNPAQALDLLAHGRAEGAITSLFSASYFLSSRGLNDTLQMRVTVGQEPARIAMATSRNATELTSILDKALSSIAPEDLAAINNRWRTYSPRGSGAWHDYQLLIYQIIGGAGILLLGSLAWNAWMRRQIKQRERAERALNDQFEFMSALVNGTPHPIYVRDRDGLLKICNDSYLAAFAAQREDVIGKSILEGILSNSEEALGYVDDYNRVMADNEPLILDRSLHIGGRELTIYHWILPFRDSLGKVQGIIGGWIDISERRQLIEQLQTAKDLADDANRAKSTFLATMSHEIRTPMNAVIGMLELALKRADNGHLDRPAIEVAYSSAKDLLELIGDILDIARIESGRLSLSPERANLRQLVESVVRVFDGLARQKSLTLALDLDPRTNTDVLIDPLRFKQILSNVISNAIKFTEQGQVRISLQTEAGRSPQHMTVQVIIHDSGIGITAQDQQRLFAPFAQVDQSGQLARTGAGLGLVICRSLCEMMGGTLTLSSRPGDGTRVEMVFALTTLDPLDTRNITPQVAPHTAEPLHILIVDDHPANRLLLFEQLCFLGHRCDMAIQGAEALERWKTEPFDLVIADCNMPVMNGYDLTRAIRQAEHEQPRPRCTVLGYTANAQPEEKQRCREAGMDDCLFKPISLNALNDRLSKVRPLAVMAEAPAAVANEAFDPHAIATLTGGRIDMNERLLDQLIDSIRQDRAELASATGRDQLKDVGHKVRGAANIICATAVIQECEALEAACDAEASDEDIGKRQVALERAMTTLELALSAYRATTSVPRTGPLP
ncbi:transporter substrate-binding domain-containing protein [Pseudomonas sp. ME-P-057]|uniref:transporter substrate-binding domain-containing protein n=1 Tax=Pseudomonas sp. ME-P-057 TaxID=3040321 RepID=UPI0025532AE6|nr:transporter substrate-binding domain-containing protein [Pseudomonas sp. ME-P-057]